MPVDPDEIRAQSRQAWSGAAAGWLRREATLRGATAPVSRWLVDAVHLQPGHRVLELAAGVGETGFLAAELIAPGGRLTSSDRSPEMLAAARERAGELGLDNVDFREIDAEWIDAPLASFDAVLCRWGVMLMVDPAAAMREVRRVLKPGGRLAIAAWDGPEANPWASVPAQEMVGRGHLPRPDPTAPGMFALADRALLEDLLAGAGFTEIEVEAIDFSFVAPSLEAWWETQLDLSPTLCPAVEALSDQEAQALWSALEQRLVAYVGPDGGVTLPGRTLVAAASA